MSRRIFRKTIKMPVTDPFLLLMNDFSGPLAAVQDRLFVPF